MVGCLSEQIPYSLVVLNVTRVVELGSLVQIRICESGGILVPSASSLSSLYATWSILTRFDLERRAESLQLQETRTRHQ